MIPPSPFPPSFQGNPWAYGFGLFGDVAAASLSLALLLAYGFEGRRKREATRMLGDLVVQDPQPFWSPLNVYRLFHSNLLLMIVMRALPDAVWMLAWNEANEEWIRFMLWIDLVCDGLATIPFALAIACWAWTRQAIPQRLAEAGRVKMPPFTWTMIRENARIVLLVLIISIGVTFGKMSGTREGHPFAAMSGNE